MPKTPKTPKGPLSRRRENADLLSTGAVAKACGVTRDGVLHWINSGKLAAFRTPGGHYRVRRDDLAAFLRQTRSGYPGAPRDGAAHILVVDDEPTLVALMQELLVDEGYDVATAEAPAPALSAIAERVPDLVITDVALPDGGGAGLTRALRADPVLATVPVIAVTGAFGDIPLEEIYRAGADVLIAKPFRVEHLVGEVRRLLGEPVRPVSGSGPDDESPVTDDDGCGNDPGGSR